MRVTLLTPYLPHARVGHGGGISIRNMIAHLARKHAVTVVTLLRPGESDLVEVTGRELGARMVAIPFLDRQAAGADRLRLYAARLAATARALRGGRPFYVQKYWTPSLSRTVVEAVAATRPDAVQVEYLQLALLLRDLRTWRDARRRSGAPAPGLFASTHEMGSLPRRRRLERSANPLEKRILEREVAAWQRLERDAATWADRCFCVTDQDRALLEAGGGRDCVTVPLGVDVDALPPVWDAPRSDELLFVGSFAHRPNRLAADHLIDEIWKELRGRHGLTTLTLAGPGSRRHLAERSVPEGVTALGFVDDLKVLYRRCRLFVAPLTEGGGIKIKILEAMAAGIPIVTTPVGAEGICTAADDVALIAEPGAAFAARVADAAADPEGSTARAARARAHVEEGFSWSAIARLLSREYAALRPR